MKHGADRLRRTLVGVLLLTTLLAQGACGPAPAGRLDPARNHLPLDAWVTALDADDRPCVKVVAPHRSLVFHRTDDGFASGLAVQVTAWRDGQQVGGGVGEARVTVVGQGATRGADLLTVTAPLVLRGDEPVQLDVHVSVTGTSRSWLRELTFSPLALQALPVRIIDVAMRPAAGLDGAHLVTASLDSLQLAVDLRRRAGKPTWPVGRVDLVCLARGDARLDAGVLRRPVPDDLAPGESRTVDLAWAAEELPFGRSRLQVRVELSGDDQRLRLPHEPPLDVVSLHVPVHDRRAWRRHVDWLDGYLADGARDSLAELAGARERTAAWDATWVQLARDLGEPAAELERRHVRRIVDADDRFGGFERGSLSDRGRVLIRWGEPAHIDVRADTRLVGAVWEVWTYPEHGRRVLFYDAHGIGDYRRFGEEPL